jgi:hypothetical protein
MDERIKKIVKKTNWRRARGFFKRKMPLFLLCLLSKYLLFT